MCSTVFNVVILPCSRLVHALSPDSSNGTTCREFGTTSPVSSQSVQFGHVIDHISSHQSEGDPSNITLLHTQGKHGRHERLTRTHYGPLSFTNKNCSLNDALPNFNPCSRCLFTITSSHSEDRWSNPNQSDRNMLTGNLQ